MKYIDRDGSKPSGVTPMRLAYLEIEASDLAAWRNFAQTILSAEVLEGPTDRTLLLRIDDRSFRIALREGPADDVVALGFEVDDRQALARVGEALRAADCAMRPGSAELAASRGVVELLAAADPMGLTLEFSYGALARPQAPFSPPRGHAGFVTGDQGLGHVLLSVADVDRAERFYQDVLGFRVTDYVATNYNGRDARFVFMRANARHHTLAVGHLPVGKRLLHFMLQCRDLDDVGRALDRVPASGLRQTRSLGRHINDRMLSFYMETPSKVQVEYGFGGVEIEAESTWSVATYDVTSIWGHKHL
jgi:2,3-dihydroxybiphenyl 1,2-dioxygenase